MAATGRAQYVEDSIDVGGSWVGSLAYNSREEVLYGASNDGVFFVISCDSNRVIASQQLSGAFELAYDSIDNKAWCSFSGAEQDSLAVIDGKTHAVVKEMEMPGATMPVWDGASGRLYVTCQTTGSVAVLDAKTDSLLTYIPVGATPLKMYLNSFRRKLYVLNSDDGTVSVVDLQTDRVIKTIVVGGDANAGYYSRKVDKFYCDGPWKCAIISGFADKIVAWISVPGGQSVLSATGNEQAGIVFAGMFAGNSGYIVAIDAEADSVLYVHDLGHALAEALFYSTKSCLLYSVGYPNSFDVLTGDGSQVVKKDLLGDSPFVLAYAPTHDRIYVGNLGSRWVYVLRDNEAVRAMRPESVGILSIAPNPFTKSMAVIWNFPTKGGGVARVYAQDGSLVRQTWIPSGVSRWVWDGRDSRGRAMPPGVYVIAAADGVRAKAVKLK